MPGLLTHHEKLVWIVSDGPGGHIFEVVESEADAKTIYRYYRGSSDVTLKSLPLVTEAELHS